MNTPARGSSNSAADIRTTSPISRKRRAAPAENSPTTSTTSTTAVRERHVRPHRPVNKNIIVCFKKTTAAIVVASLIVTLRMSPFLLHGTSLHKIRMTTQQRTSRTTSRTSSSSNLPIVFPYLSPLSSFHLLDSSRLQHGHSNRPNYYGLRVNHTDYDYQTLGRRIGGGNPQQQDALYKKERDIWLSKMNVDAEGLKWRLEYDEDYYALQQQKDNDNNKKYCQRNNWRSKKFPTCNALHELPLIVFDYEEDAHSNALNVSYRGHGHYRDSWLFATKSISTAESTRKSGIREEEQLLEEEFIVKTIRLKQSFDIGMKYMYQIHKEAIIMERLTQSPRIVDIFAYCSTTILAEHMASEVSPDMLQGYVYGENDYVAGYMKQAELDTLQKDDVKPMNNLTLDQKLDLAIVMAESIADIHGYEGGVIAHGDIHPVQWLRNKKGQVKLNDFNNAEVLDFSPPHNAYCRVNRCYAGGTYRSPEEFRCVDCDEAMDSYSMGNNIYALLTGLWPFYQYDPHHDSKFVRNDLILQKRETPFVDPRYRTRSAIEAGLVQVMEQCWKWDLDQRLPIFEVVQQLYQLRDHVRGGGGANNDHGAQQTS